VDIISEYVKDEHIPVSQLSADAPLGQTYYGIIKAVYTQNPQNGYFVVTRILEAYGDDCTYLVNMGLNLEGVLLDLHDGSREAEMMWRFFGQLMASRQGDSFDVAWSIFGGYRRYDRVYQLYTLALEGAAGFEGCRTVFDRHYRTFVQRDPAYAGEYRMQVLEAYESSLRAFDGESVYGCREELFRILYSEKLDISFADNLVRELVRPIPVKSPSRADGKLLQDIFNYTYNFRRKPVTGKALLLIIAMVLENVRGRSEFAARLEQLQQLTRGGRGDLTRASEKGVEDYFDWLLPVICELCGQTKDLEAIYDLFEMAPAVERQFFARCARLYLKQDKGEKNHGLFCRFLGLVFRRGNSSVREEVGRTLCRLNKQKLEDLDAAVKENFREDAVALMYWEEIRKTAEDTNPILSNISGIFKRRKD